MMKNTHKGHRFSKGFDPGRKIFTSEELSANRIGKRVKYAPPLEFVARPFCLKCRRQMCQQGNLKNGRVYVSWTCAGCRVKVTMASARTRKTLTEKAPAGPRVIDEETAAELADRFARGLPRYLPFDAREDARQDALLAYLEGRDVDRTGLRRIGLAALGMTQDRFRFRSLDAPIPGTDGLTWGETLIG